MRVSGYFLKEQRRTPVSRFISDAPPPMAALLQKLGRIVERYFSLKSGFC